MATITKNNGSEKDTPQKVYYNGELGVNNIYFDMELRGIQGIALEFEYVLSGTPVLLTATSVSSERVSNKTFRIPDGYTETTEKQLQNIRVGLNKK